MIWIEFVKRLKATKMPLDEIRKFSDLRIEGSDTVNKRSHILENHQERVSRQIAELLVHQETITDGEDSRHSLEIQFEIV